MSSFAKTAESFASDQQFEDISNTVQMPISFMADGFDIEIHSDFASTQEDWLRLQRQSGKTIYQNHSWQRAWFETIGESEGLELAVVKISSNGKTHAILPLGISHSNGIGVASLMGGSHANYKMLLLDEDHPISSDVLTRLLKEIGQRLPQKVDWFEFNQIIEKWNGVSNPLFELAGTEAHSFGNSIGLQGGIDAYMARGNAKKRKKEARRIEKIFTTQHETELLRPHEPSEKQALYDEFVLQRQQWSDEAGRHNFFDDAPHRAFFYRLAELDTSGNTLRMNSLLVDGVHRAITGGATHNGTFFCYFTAYRQDDLARLSPGKHLMQKEVEHACEHNCVRYDLGMGEEQYKNQICNEFHTLKNIYLPVTAKGVVFCQILRTKDVLKRRIRRSEKLWPLVKKLRASLSK